MPRARVTRAALSLDGPLSTAQRELLDVAFRAASALPVDPHLKTRSRLQEAVVAAALRLQQPVLARSYAQGIGNWRRGACAADLACYYATHDRPDDTLLHLEEAQRIADTTELEGDVQAWRRDRIRAKIAATHLLLGHDETARLMANGVGDSETGHVETVKARTMAEDRVGDYLVHLDQQFERGNLEQARAGLDACTHLFDRFYSNVERREQTEARVRSAYPKLPPQIRLELLQRLVVSALDHADHSKALALVSEAQELVDKSRWLLEDHVRWLAQLAALRDRAGAHAQAQHQIGVALAMFDRGRDQIMNIERADVLRAVAEATWSMRDPAAALAVYQRALEAGVENPNSRPRAEDLSATCLSLALNDVAANGALRARITDILNGLGHPW